MGKIPEKFKETVDLLANKFNGKQCAFRGTASLVLQGLDMNVDDIDLLTDKDTALLANKLLNKYLVDEVKYRQSEKFKSFYGKFNINSIQIEVMGDWQIRDIKGSWCDSFDASDDECSEINLNGKSVRVTKIETELVTYSKMGRWTAFQKIKRQLGSRKSNQQVLI